MKTLEERLWSKVNVSGVDECWPFLGNRNRGYGLIKKKVAGRWVQYPAARAAYECSKGDIPEGHEIDHTCCNPSCCNPAHLDAVTHTENMKRIYERKRGGSGHQLGAEHGRARFTREQVEELKEDPRSARELARIHGCSHSIILRMRSGQTYQMDGRKILRHR